MPIDWCQLKPFVQKHATMVAEFKDGCMKVNYQARIETTASELKIIVGQQRTITNRQKVQALYFLKAGSCQSITDV